jgi:chromosome transmission fidelity protein 1
MDAIYECIDSSSVGCFESPTGTGKSLSSICAAFTWLLNEEKRILAEIKGAKEKNDISANGDDWLADIIAPKVQSSDSALPSPELVTRYRSVVERIARSNHPTKLGNRQFFQRTANAVGSAEQKEAPTGNTTAIFVHLTATSISLYFTFLTDRPEADVDEFALRHYDSDEEQRAKLAAALEEHSDSSGDSGSDTSQAPGRAHRGGAGSTSTRRRSVMDRLHLPQIFYCSRTHSQLAQFVDEMKKTDFVKPDAISGIAPIRCVTLGARRNLCIHPAVSKLKSEGSVSEACLELQKVSSRVTKSSVTASTAPSSGKCLCSGVYQLLHTIPRSYHCHLNNYVLWSHCCRRLTYSTYRLHLSIGAKKAKLRKESATKCPHHTRALERTLADRSLARIRDIEEVVTLGHDLGACPYYASRTAVQGANVVCLPYSMLLSKEMRESLGIDIAGTPRPCL